MSVCARSRVKGGLYVKRHHPALPSVRRGARIEPAVLGFPDFVHGERVDTFPPDKRRFLTYQRHEHSVLFLNALLDLPHQQGIRGLTSKHFLFDSMHCVELGIV
eukprot:4798338-Pyramimonas_sp.AAC.1